MKRILSVLIINMLVMNNVQAGSIWFVNTTDKTLSVHVQSKYKKQKSPGIKVTRHDEETYTLAPNKGAEFNFSGAIQIFNISDTAKDSLIKPLEVDHGLKDSQGKTADNKPSQSIVVNNKSSNPYYGQTQYLAISLQNNQLQTTWTTASLFIYATQANESAVLQLTYYDSNNNIISPRNLTLKPLNDIIGGNSVWDTTIIFPNTAYISVATRYFTIDKQKINPKKNYICKTNKGLSGSLVAV